MMLRLAWRNLWRHTRRTLITAFAMAVGVSLSMAYLAFADGMFGDMFDRMVGAQTGHAQLHQPDYPKQRALYDTIKKPGALEEEVRGVEGVGATAARVFGYGLLAVGDESAGGQLMGIDPAAEKAIRDLDARVTNGRYLSAKPAADRKEALLGYQLADNLEAQVGDELVVVTQAADGSLGNELYEIVGLVKTGALAIDHRAALLHRSDAQELLALPDQVHEIAIVAEDKDQIDPVIAALRDHFAGRDDLLLRSWGELNPMALQMVGMQDAMYLLIALIILSVAGIGILNTMLMSVFERTKELGVLIALGLKPRRILRLIMTETLLLSLVAVGIGLLMGGLLDWYLVVHGFDFGVGFEWGGVVFDPVIHGRVTAAGILIVVACVPIVSLLASLWPAARAARLQPVVAMREE